jgi:hypothetical protein
MDLAAAAVPDTVAAQALVRDMAVMVVHKRTGQYPPLVFSFYFLS